MDFQKLLHTIDQLPLADGGIQNSVAYEAYCKLAATLCFKENLHTSGIYYLSEAHGASIREECFRQSSILQVRSELQKTTFTNGLNLDYISFRSSYAKKKYDGLCERLRSLPKEWTLVQITRSYDPAELWTKRRINSVPELSELHVVRYSCGDSDEPCHILIPKDNFSNDGAEGFLKLLSETVLDETLHMNLESARRIREKRKHNCLVLKSLTREITTSWLREWCCFLLGKICNKELKKSIRKSVNEIFEQSKVSVSYHTKLVVMQVANGCAHLNDAEIESAVSYVIKDSALLTQLTERIMQIRNDNCNMIITKRYPVILLLDEKLECVPWEMTPILRKHPVSRLPSVHFVQALFKKHENTILNGNKILSQPVSGFYIINPDQSLQSTEERITNFLNVRFSNWHGVVGTAPSKNDFEKALTNYNFLLYCGHGSGVQYMSINHLMDINVQALPLLFGCNSVEHKDLGGRIPFACYANNFLIAASPCVLGMLWSVTSTDIDNVAVTLLNHWLPGKPVNPNDIEGFKREFDLSCDLSFKEPELLRVLKVARDSAMLFFNACATVVYGIPVKVEEK